jgi:hypothetical protein
MTGRPSELVATGDNFSLHVDDGVVLLRVWSQRDMSFARGAELAQTKLEHLRRLVVRADVRALVFDLVAAAPVVGPVTEAAVRSMIHVFAERRLPVAVVVGESPMQALQFTRLLREAGTKDDHHGLVTRDHAAADTFVRRSSS